MEGLLSIKQIIRKLKGSRWSWIPSPEAVHILFDKYGVGPVGGSHPYLKYYYNGRYALDIILQHVMELKAIQERIDMRKNVIKMNHQDMDDTRDSYEDEVSFYHPKGMSNASMELLKNDDVWYDGTVEDERVNEAVSWSIDNFLRELIS